MSFDQLWAGWRMPYVSAATESENPQEAIIGPLAADECVFCAILGADATDRERLVVHRGELVVAILNAFPYASGHVMVMPLRHVRELDELTGTEAAELWATTTRAVSTLRATYKNEGCNVGLNLGRAGGAGIPGHLHVHIVPRWVGDTNFMTTTASVRVLPEALTDSWSRLSEAWR